MLTAITKFAAIAIITISPVLAAIAYVRSLANRSFAKHRQSMHDMTYMDSKPPDHVKPIVIVQENKKVLKLNSVRGDNNAK